MIFGTYKLHTTTTGVMQILCKFFHNKHNTLDGATYDQRNCRRQTTWNALFFYKTGSYSQNIIINANTNKY